MHLFPLKISGFDHQFGLKLGFKIGEFEPELNSFTEKSILISKSFLEVIEKFPAEGLTCIYASLYDYRNEVAGFYLFQIKYFRASQSMKFNEEDDIFCKLHKKMKSLVANLVEFNTLIGGNLLLSGPFGFLLKDKYRSHEGLIYQHVIEQTQEWLKTQGYDCNILLIKDYFEEHKLLKESTFHSFSIQPNMMMDIPSEWNHFNDYLDALHSKYRIRAKRAFKSVTEIEKKELSGAEVNALNESLYKLYKETATHAEFNLLDLHPAYFNQLKNYLGAHIHFYSYTLENVLVAFFTIIEDGDEAEAHFLGINESYNREYQLYLNVLFDIIHHSIDLKKKRIRFSRTAIEIKSSVGAKAVGMTCYIKHRKVINNTFVPYLLDFLNQKQEYVIRHPFKEIQEIGVKSELLKV